MTIMFKKLLHSHYLPHVLLTIMSAYFFIHLGSVHLFDWDEINFAESAREMMVSKNYLTVQINYEPFWEKPPLFFWMQLLVMKIFGVNEFAARFPNALFGGVYLWTLYFIGRKIIQDSKFAWLWVLMIFGSVLPHLYFKSGIIDPVFNFFIFLSIYKIYIFFQALRPSRLDALYAGLFCGLSFLTKGPVGLLIVFCTSALAAVFYFWKPVWFNKSDPHPSGATSSDLIKRLILSPFLYMFLLGFLALVSIWLGAEIYYHGLQIISQFIVYQIELFNTPVAGHGQPFYYHFVVVLLGCFPASVFAIPRLLPGIKSVEQIFSIWMISLFWVVMIIFSISTTKIVHYSSLTYLPLGFLAATYLSKLIQQHRRPGKLVLSLYILIGSIWSLLFLVGLYFVGNLDQFKGLIKDEMTLASIDVAVQWSGFEFLIGLLFIVGFVYSVFGFMRKKIFASVWVMSFTTATTLLCVSIWVLPGIESYSQGPAIRFYEGLADKDVYVETIGFKSYAHYFYKKKLPQSNSKSADKQWLLTGRIDKDAYFVSRMNNHELDEIPGVIKIGCEGSFCFYKRKVLE